MISGHLVKRGKSFSLTDSFCENTSIARLAETEERHSDYQICNAAKQQLKVSSGGGTLQLLRINIEGIVQGFIDCPFMRLAFQCWLTVHIVQVSESRLANGTAMIGAFGSVKTRSQAVPFAPCSTPIWRSCVAAHFPKQQDFPPTMLAQSDLAWERDEEIWWKF